MSRAQPETRRGRRGKRICALLLTTSLLALLRPAVLYAQETELRGEVSESAILADQQRKTRQLTIAGSQGQSAPADATEQDDSPTPPYLPASAGAVPDDTGRQPRPTVFSISRRPVPMRPPTILLPPRSAGHRPQNKAPPMKTTPRPRPSTKRRQPLSGLQTRPPTTIPAPSRRTRTRPTAVPSPSTAPTVRSSIPAPSAPAPSKHRTRRPRTTPSRPPASRSAPS